MKVPRRRPDFDDRYRLTDKSDPVRPVYDKQTTQCRDHSKILSGRDRLTYVAWVHAPLAAVEFEIRGEADVSEMAAVKVVVCSGANWRMDDLSMSLHYWISSLQWITVRLLGMEGK